MENTINLKELSHQEMDTRIFSELDNLDVDKFIKFIFDFNPLPLIYMLKARGDFEIYPQKEGPDEWILNIKRIKKSIDYRSEFKELLKSLGSKEVSLEVKTKAKEIFKALDAKTLGILEQELIKEGITHEEIRRSLCDIHLEVLKDTLISKRIEVESPHPVHTFMEEHKMILNFLNELSMLIKRLMDKKSFSEMKEDLELLKHISQHLVEAESHHQREEDVLFPRLIKYGITEPVEIMKLDHTEYREKKKALYKLAHNYNDYSFEDFKKDVISLGEYLAKELESHIFKEDNILYQIALQTLGASEWEEVKKECDRIGYCCFTPSNHNFDQKRD